MEILKKPIYILIIILVLIIAFLPSYTRLSELEQKNRELEEKIKELEERNLALEEEKRNLENDPFYIEKVAREKMGVVRKGEVIYKIEEE